MTAMRIEPDSLLRYQIQYLTDVSQTGFVTIHRFSNMVRAFGPLALLSHHVSRLFGHKWFHGYLSTSEAAKLMERFPNSFLVRFPGVYNCADFVLSKSSGEGSSQQMTHIHLERHADGFTIESDGDFLQLNDIQEITSTTGQLSPVQASETRVKSFCGLINASEGSFYNALEDTT